MDDSKKNSLPDSQYKDDTGNKLNNNFYDVNYTVFEREYDPFVKNDKKERVGKENAENTQYLNGGNYDMYYYGDNAMRENFEGTNNYSDNMHAESMDGNFAENGMYYQQKELFPSDSYYRSGNDLFSSRPFTGEMEQPLYVNAHQFNCIRKRKLRRDFLDSITVNKNSNSYLHESRHRHAMNRLRAPSGRFLTKEEAEEMRAREKQSGE